MITASMLTLFGIGIVSATILSIASKIFYVEEDPRIEAVLEALPGANCGGCGYAGCEGYAIAVIKDPSVPANLCVVGTEKTCVDVATLANKTIAVADPQVSFRRCDKVNGHVTKKYLYQGISSCTAVSMLMSGSDTCSWSCLGLGDCVQACPFDAMEIQNGLVSISQTKCTGCGICIKLCPRNSLELIPQQARVSIFCATKEKLKAVTDICHVGCINCGKCIKSCPAKAITNPKGRIEIDQKTCLAYGPGCDEICVTNCPRNILRSL